MSKVTKLLKCSEEPRFPVMQITFRLVFGTAKVKQSVD